MMLLMTDIQPGGDAWRRNHVNKKMDIDKLIESVRKSLDGKVVSSEISGKIMVLFRNNSAKNFRKFVVENFMKR